MGRKSFNFVCQFLLKGSKSILDTTKIQKNWLRLFVEYWFIFHVCFAYLSTVLLPTVRMKTVVKLRPARAPRTPEELPQPHTPPVDEESRHIHHSYQLLVRDWKPQQRIGQWKDWFAWFEDKTATSRVLKSFTAFWARFGRYFVHMNAMLVVQNCAGTAWKRRYSARTAPSIGTAAILAWLFQVMQCINTCST